MLGSFRRYPGDPSSIFMDLLCFIRKIGWSCQIRRPRIHSSNTNALRMLNTYAESFLCCVSIDQDTGTSIPIGASDRPGTMSTSPNSA